MSTIDTASVYDVAGTVTTQTYASAVLGPCAAGWCGQLMGFGVVLAWFIAYLKTDLWVRDSRRRKAMIVVVFAACAFQAGCNVYAICFWSVSVDRSAAALVRPTVADALQPFSSAVVIAPLTQFFLGSRAVRLLDHKLAKIAAISVFSILIVVEFGAAIFNVVISLLFHMGRLEGTLLNAALFNKATGVWLICGAVVDVLISVLLIVLLRKRIETAFFDQTFSLIRRIISLSVMSASYTAVLAAVAAIIAYAAPADDLLLSSVPYAFWYLLPSLYAIALLNTLSSRSVFSTGSSNSGPSTALKTRLTTRHLNGLTFDLPTSPTAAGAHKRANQDPSRSFFDAVDLKTKTGGTRIRGGGGGVGANTIQVEMHTVVVEETEKDLEAGMDSGDAYQMEKLPRREHKEEWSD